MEKLGSIENNCAMCNESLVKEKGKDVEVAELRGKYYHHRCFLKLIPEENYKVLIVVTPRSIGDAISHTPLIREFKRIYTKANVDVLTVFPELFKFNPLVRNVIPFQDGCNRSIYKHYDVRFSPFILDKPHSPLHMMIHSVDFVSYGMFRKMLKPEHKHYDIYYTYLDKENMIKKCADKGLDVVNDDFILLHPHKAFWKTRTWAPENWQEITNRLNENYLYKTVSIGGNRETQNLKISKMDNRVELDNCIDLYNELTLLETVALMDYANLLITMDTGAMHIAAASKCPIFCMFSVVNSEYRVPYRDGIKGKDFYHIDSECNCVYDIKQITESINIHTCPKKYDPIKCLPKLDVSWDKIKEILGG